MRIPRKVDVECPYCATVLEFKVPNMGNVKYDVIVCGSCEKTFIARITLTPTVHTATIQGE